MSWIFLVLLSSAIWASTNFIDKYLIEKYFTNKVGVLIVFSGLIGFFVAPIFLFLEPTAIFINPFFIFIIILNSFLLILYLFPYFKALEFEDTSIVAARFQLIPVVSIILGFFILGEILSLIQIFAAIIIIFSSIGISANFDKNALFNLKTFFLMLLASFMIALNSVIFKLFSIDFGFFAIAFWQYVGFGIFAIFLLLFVKKYRIDFFFVLKKSGKRIISINAFNEIINVFAQIIFWSTFVLAPIGLIWLFNGFQPFFILIIGILLTIFFPKIIKENISRQMLFKKILFIFLLFVGGFLLTISV
jgi:uncharacterized membrane protein